MDDTRRDQIIQEGQRLLEQAREKTGLANVTTFPRSGVLVFYDDKTVLEVCPGIALCLLLDPRPCLGFQVLATRQIIKLTWDNAGHWVQQRPAGESLHSWSCVLELD